MNLITRDLQHIWHPCTPMKDFELNPPIIVTKARGSYLYTNKGKIIDAISSWWCKSLGHRHPNVTKAIKKQLQQFEHIISANTTHKTIVELGEVLSHLTGKQHLYFGSDGSSAVEIAMKLALHAQKLRGHPEKCEFLSLKNAYHGETLATMAVSSLGLFKQPYEAITLKNTFIDPLPYVNQQNEFLWDNCESVWEQVLPILKAKQANAAAIIVEPIIQGAAGMQLYSADFLNRIAKFAKENQIYLIADEIMTGLCRTGPWLASSHAKIDPDLICVSKGLTSGTIPLSCTLIDNSIYELFYEQPRINNFLHSHTFSGHALGCAAALATLKVMQEINLPEKIKILEQMLLHAFKEVAYTSGRITNIRNIGGIVAGDIIDDPNGTATAAICQGALVQGALLRPIGNTLYWLPPLNITQETIGKLAKITLNSIDKCQN